MSNDANLTACNACGGRGYNLAAESEPGSNPPTLIKEPCLECCGTGQVEKLKQ